jgi:hypothetical protein
MRDGECLAAESGFRHPYRVGDEIVDVVEVFDWYCLPELRNSGLGVRIMQRFMREPHPLLLVGGSADTQGLLPRLGWRIVARATRWSRTLGADAVARSIERRLRVPGAVARALAPAALALAGRGGRRHTAPRDGRAIAVTTLGPEALRLQRGRIGHGTLPLWTPELLRWLGTGFAGLGHFLPVYFALGAELRGFALLRIHPTESGCGAEILDLFSPTPEPDLYAWFVAELVRFAAGFGPGHVAATTTCPALAEALRRNGFAEATPNPVQLWWPGREGLPGPVAIASNTGDTPILPLVERWFPQPEGPVQTRPERP